MDIVLADESATESFGKQLAVVCPRQALIFLRGDLGAGKTTLTRGFLRGLGYHGKVKSPTYTLVEPYEISTGSGTESGIIHVYHFDLYRLADPEELAYMGAEDYFAEQAISLVEWPEQGVGMLPQADIELHLEYQPNGRLLNIQAHSGRGQQILEQLDTTSAITTE
ncbi:MAG: tRNA (adenosine(37)-N6)-threonylcarbamoyltransferase complex ATPase subunit type 1 TsaE [Gammaproteobacteria bacterium]|nr:tRNA (adenosine(37)-N6)-threonylcarbamoyltransferase complex ATPase subunit type 1 TsaE [Gammaproteobacteria bacterium]